MIGSSETTGSSPHSGNTSRRTRSGGLSIERTQNVGGRDLGRSGTGPYSPDDGPVVWTEARRVVARRGVIGMFEPVGAGPRPARAGVDRVDRMRLYAGTRCTFARAISRSVQRSALAQIVAVGAIGPEVTKTLPSMT